MRTDSLLFILLMIISSCSNQLTVSSIKEDINESNNIPVVIQVDTNNIRTYHKDLNTGRFFNFYNHNPLGTRKKTFIKEVTLNNNENKYQLQSIFLFVDKVARIHGGNFIHIKKVYQGKLFGKNLNTVKMDIYQVDDLGDLVQYYYWHKDRELKIGDYNKIAAKKDTINSDFLYDGLPYIEPNEKEMNLIFVNKFLKEKSICNPCSEIDLLRENVKFDLIELLQRRIVKAELEYQAKNNEKLDLWKRPITDSELIEASLENLNKIKDIEKLKSLSIEINNEIELLNPYRNKKIPSEFNYGPPKKKSVD